MVTGKMRFAAAGDHSALSGPAWLAPEYTIIAALPPNPEPAKGRPEIYFMANSMVKVPGGRLVAALSKGSLRPPRQRGLESLMICTSDDRGESWQFQCELPFDSCEPVMYVYGDAVYLFLTPNRSEFVNGTHFPRDDNGRIWVASSEDGGQTWSEPVLVLRGEPFYTSGGETSLYERDGKLYWTVSERYQTLAAVCCDLRLGLKNPAAWRISPLVSMPIPQALVHGRFSDGSTMRCLEGNVLEVQGRLIVLARAVINRYGTSGLGAVFEIHDEQGPLRLEFLQLYPIPGGQCKFYTVRDPVTGLYWMASNLASNARGWYREPGLDESQKDTVDIHHECPREDRRLLTLWYSLDSLSWIPAGWIAKADNWRQSFMYPVMRIDDEDLILISRTSWKSANLHDSDLATFHRIRDFRKLAVDIRPGL